MKTLLLGLTSLLALTTPALADAYDATEPEVLKNYYLSVGAMGSVGSFFQLGPTFEGGVRVGGSTVFGHALVSSGISGTFGANGDYQLARAGLETRHCLGRPHALCAFIGVDLGLSRDHVEDTTNEMSETAHSLVVVPRLGIEVGDRLRARAVIEAPIDHELGTTNDNQFGGALSLGVGYTF